jgi:hypothetical protein
MSIRKTRRLTIADGMVLIAALTFGLAMARSVIQWWLNDRQEMQRQNVSSVRGLYSLMILQSAPPCLVFPLMLALIPLRLRRPRPALSIIARQQGFAACCAGVAAFALGALNELWSIFLGEGRYSFWQSCTVWGDSIVPGAWLFLALSGRWRSQPDWIDRLGRILGAFWVVYLTHYLFSPWLMAWLPNL